MSRTLPKAGERRAFPRRCCGAPTVLGGDYGAFWTLCLDVSLGGASLSTDAVVPVGEILDLRVDLGACGRIEGVGRVLRSRAGRVGVEFVRLAPGSHFAIASYLRGRPAGGVH